MNKASVFSNKSTWLGIGLFLVGASLIAAWMIGGGSPEAEADLPRPDASQTARSESKTVPKATSSKAVVPSGQVVPGAQKMRSKNAKVQAAVERMNRIRAKRKAKRKGPQPIAPSKRDL